MRKAVYAGLFYPTTVDTLQKVLDECFNSELGPGALPTRPKPNALPVKAVICPHAGYVYSGMAAAWSYKAVAEAPLPDLFILIGPNHRTNESGISVKTFETPLGFVRVDQDFAKVLAGKGNIKINEKIHEPEHSLEVQLPFLQFVLGDRAEKIKILPLLVSDDLDIDKAVNDLKETIKELKRKVTFIVSSDFTHYGPSYGYTPFTDNIKENLAKLDNGAIEFIKEGDVNGFELYIQETGASICGFLPILLLLKIINSKKVFVESYYTSADVTGDYSNSVSYVSMVFR
ncbi:MAG: AmmeMemoRadiSam system protein B [Nanoarchaeota archaeon]|nr:AmmeMemoRadiSam system protein B [Nanoarchaeota archaeon]MBU1322290.1 AmmeMemoRadiSam system protein B [Nanoarchaeota archaeon]MBU1597829.1 AmmeMemoRadiSam system protein B [Nanoarchaeota archaeon]MBU2441082.1 AmmeMemoRadiSam system protein B [Nanoarchaeota archaeon]